MNMFYSDHHVPLAKRMSPKSFNEYEGQLHLVGLNKPIRSMVESKSLCSMILYGPVASGKTGLAQLIAHQTDAHFISTNAVSLNAEEIKAVLKTAQQNKYKQQTILFIDEIHRLIRPKQDMFLEALELGELVLIGATTENPLFSLQPALRSRLLIFELFALEGRELYNILDRALSTDVILQELNVVLDAEAQEYLVQHTLDPRKMLTVLESIVLSKSTGFDRITYTDVVDVMNNADTMYDKCSEHYDTISAFIKSIRGSDPDAALYYLAVLIESGEDPQFIFRRLLILSVEDIGLAYPKAITVVQSCADAFDRVGFPEGKLFLSHAVLFLSGLPKSDSVLSINHALDFVRQGNILSIPPHLKDNHHSVETKYKNPHHYPNGFIEQSYTYQPVSFYQAKESGFEKKIKDRYLMLSKNL